MIPAATAIPSLARPRQGILATTVLAAGLMLFPSQATAQCRDEKPAETQQASRRQNVIVRKGDVLSARSGKCTFQLRITRINKRDMEFLATAREVEIREEGGVRKEYIKETKLETSVEYGQAWSWGGAVFQAEGKGAGAAALAIECEGNCPELRKATVNKPQGKKKVKEGSI